MVRNFFRFKQDYIRNISGFFLIKLLLLIPAVYGSSDTHENYIDSIINDVASEYGLPPDLIKSVVWHESNYKVRAFNSVSQARGLMQLRDVAILDVHGHIPPSQVIYDPLWNITTGVKYFLKCMEWAEGDLERALSYYHMGYGNARSGSMGESTSKYVKGIIGNTYGEGGYRDLINSYKYLYAVARYGNSISFEYLGMEASPVYFITYRDIGAAVSDFSQARIDVMQESILTHERVVEAIMRYFNLLPVRFGTILADAMEVREALCKNYRKFKDSLKRVAGRVEFGIRVLIKSDGLKVMAGDLQQGVKDSRTAVATRLDLKLERCSPVKGYLLEKIENQRAEDAIIERIAGITDDLQIALEGYVDDSRVIMIETKGIVLTADYLVPKKLIGSFKEEFNRFKARHEDFSFLLSGPWPPYNFIYLSEKSLSK